jgi:hypothetical protein
VASRSLKVAAADEASTQPMPTDQELRVEITEEEAGVSRD